MDIEVGDIWLGQSSYLLTVTEWIIIGIPMSSFLSFLFIPSATSYSCMHERLKEPRSQLN